MRDKELRAAPYYLPWISQTIHKDFIKKNDKILLLVYKENTPNISHTASFF